MSIYIIVYRIRLVRDKYNKTGLQPVRIKKMTESGLVTWPKTAEIGQITKKKLGEL